MPRLLFLFFLSLLHTPLFAQSTTGEKLLIGPTLGLNASTTSISQVFITDNKYGFNVGVKAKYPLGKRLMLNSLLVYTQKGSSGQYSDWDEEFSYLELPVFLSYALGKEATRFYPLVGIQQGYLLRARTSLSTLGGLPVPTSSAEAYRYELGLSVGIGSQFQVSSKSSLFLDIRYASGLTNIWKGSGLFTRQDGFYPAYYNTVFSFNTGVLF